VWRWQGARRVSAAAHGRPQWSRRLQLNRRGAVNLRRALLALGEEHPPASNACD